MKTGLVFLSIGLLLLILLFSRGAISFTKTTVDVHVSDTYFVLSYLIFILFIGLFLGTFFALGSTIATSFKDKFFLLMFFAFVVADAALIGKYNNLFQ
jgi:hypothetical protein